MWLARIIGKEKVPFCQDEGKKDTTGPVSLDLNYSSRLFTEMKLVPSKTNAVFRVRFAPDATSFKSNSIISTPPVSNTFLIPYFHRNFCPVPTGLMYDVRLHKMTKCMTRLDGNNNVTKSKNYFSFN